MRLSRAWTIASKDFRIFFRRKNTVVSFVAFVGLVSIGLPFVIRLIVQRAADSSLLPQFMNAFSVWFVIGAVLLPVTIASYSLVGEKIQKSLEPLLATPVTDGEILAGKSIAAFLPAIGASYVGALIFMTLADLFTYKTLHYLYYPNWDMAIILLLLVPAASMLGVGYNVLVSSRVNDVRAAQQLGSLVVLPLGSIYFLSEFGVLTLDAPTFLIIAAVLAAVDVIVFVLVKGTFQREEILTRWK